MMTLRIHLAVCALVAIAGMGCSSEPPAPKVPSGQSSPADENASNQEKPAAADPSISLAAAGNPTPPLDGGRVQSTMPEGWKFLPRSADYLIALYHQEKGGVPRLVLREEDAGDLPATDSAVSAKPLADKLKAEFPSGNEPQFSVLHVGDNWFVRFEKKMSFRSERAAGLFLVTVQGGKRFTLELLTLAEKKEEFLPALYRFAADLKVTAAEPAETPTSSEEPVAGEQPDQPM